VLCDVDPESGVMTAETLEPALSERTRAVVVVHLYGQAADMPALMELCDARGVTVVEDCAQAHGARVAGRPAGTFGAAGCFSFYPTKNLGALGDGGAVVTADDELAGRLARLRTYGQADRYRHVEHGVNSRLDELQAAVLRARLPRVAAGNARRREIADRYTAALDGTPVVPLRRLPDREHAFHLFVVRAPDRDGFQAALRADGIDTLVHYPEPIHGHPPYRALGQGVSLAHAERLAVEVVSLPLYPELSDAEVAHVAARARAAAQRS
jgi:dTDP-4-amino-4,6-dideoxygalactose transaminase